MKRCPATVAAMSASAGPLVALVDGQEGCRVHDAEVLQADARLAHERGLRRGDARVDAAVGVGCGGVERRGELRRGRQVAVLEHAHPGRHRQPVVAAHRLHRRDLDVEVQVADHPSTRKIRCRSRSP